MVLSCFQEVNRYNHFLTLACVASVSSGVAFAQGRGGGPEAATGVGPPISSGPDGRRDRNPETSPAISQINEGSSVGIAHSSD